MEQRIALRLNRVFAESLKMFLFPLSLLCILILNPQVEFCLHQHHNYTQRDPPTYHPHIYSAGQSLIIYTMQLRSTTSYSYTPAPPSLAAQKRQPASGVSKSRCNTKAAGLRKVNIKKLGDKMRLFKGQLFLQVAATAFPSDGIAELGSRKLAITARDAENGVQDLRLDAILGVPAQYAPAEAEEQAPDVDTAIMEQVTAPGPAAAASSSTFTSSTLAAAAATAPSAASLSFPFHEAGEPAKEPQDLHRPEQTCYRRSMTMAFCHLQAPLQRLIELETTHKATMQQHSAEGCVACTLRSIAAGIWAGKATGALRAAVERLDKLILQEGRASGDDYFKEWMKTTSAQADCTDPLPWLVDNLGYSGRESPSNPFGLELRCRPTCEECGKSREDEREPDQRDILNTYIADETVASKTLLECLRARLTEKIEFPCSNCCKTQQFDNKWSISKAPRVLFIQLLRLIHRGGSIEKLQKEIDHPEELDLTQFRQGGSNGSTIYRLRSVICHRGESNSGHYVTYARGPAGYAFINDEKVEQTSLR